MELRSRTNNFSLLPAHIITNVLGYLDLDDFKTASAICKSWYYASNDPKIARTLVLQPKEKDFLKICKSNRKYGILKLVDLKFNKMDSHYFQLFEKFCPFIYQLHITYSYFKQHHLLKLLELTNRLEFFSINYDDYTNNHNLFSLFPISYDSDAKNLVYKNLSTVKNLTFNSFNNIPLIIKLIRCTTNLETLRIFYEYDDNNSNNYYELSEIFEYENFGNLRHLSLKFDGFGLTDFITDFIKIKKFNLKSFEIGIYWNWMDEGYNSSLFRQFILKLQQLEEFKISELEHDQLSIICQHMVNLKSFECDVDDHQPISEIGNLKKLEKLWCSTTNYYAHAHFDEIDLFFKNKFHHLRILHFNEFVTEPNLKRLCEDHPNLIELALFKLLTRNLEMIFKYLTKLRVLQINFGFDELSQEERDNLPLSLLIECGQEYKFNISRLHDLETFHLNGNKFVNGVRECDVRKLKKLRITNLPITKK